MSWLLYDGDCPFCSNYVAFLNLRERFPDLELVNLREDPQHEAVASVQAMDLKLDEGMALVKANGEVIYGAEAINELAEDGTLNGWLFGSKRRSKAIYPALKAGRKITLKLLGRKKLGF